MKTFLEILAVFGLCVAPIFSHGGTYRGPGDTVPPGGGGAGGGGGPATPGPGGPGTPAGGTSPLTPGPRGPGTPGAGGPFTGPTTGGGAPMIDLTGWSFWWEFNKDPYLSLKDKIYSHGPGTGSDGFFLGHGEKEQSRDVLKPSEADIRENIVPALISTLGNETNNDIITGCLMSLAKIGNQEEYTSFGHYIIPFLTDKNQEISETAALALGILGAYPEDHIQILEELATDSQIGRSFVERNEVPFRTRAFSVYGLGLIARDADNQHMRNLVSTQLQEIITSDNSSYRDVKVAAIVSMSLLELKGDARNQQINFLLDYFTNGDNVLVRSHVPEALVLTVRGSEEEMYKEVIAKEFMETLKKSSKERREVQQSCALALGLLGDTDSEDIDKAIRKTLYEIPNNISDIQTKAFSLIALAHVGSNLGDGDDSLKGYKEIQKHLITQCVKGKSQTKNWAIMALGVMANRLNQEGSVIPSHIYSTLRHTLEFEHQSERFGPLGVALGLAGDVEAGPILLDKLNETKNDEARGYMCVGLGLINQRSAIEDIRNLVLNSKYRPELLQQASIGLGLMGDYELVLELVDMLKQSKSLASQAAVVRALGFIGDKRSITPLVEFLNDQDNTDVARGFAAVTLGMVAEKSSLPWNSDLSCDLNYRASTTTLTDIQGTGILNIL